MSECEELVERAKRIYKERRNGSEECLITDVDEYYLYVGIIMGILVKLLWRHNVNKIDVYYRLTNATSDRRLKEIILEYYGNYHDHRRIESSWEWVVLYDLMEYNPSECDHSAYKILEGYQSEIS